MTKRITPILAYHQITWDRPQKDIGSLAVSLGQFEQQMHYLHEHQYSCLPLTRLLQSPENKRTQPKKSFVLTFDDGYEDFFTQAYPILRRYGFTATIFLVVDQVGKLSNWEGECGSSLLTWEQIKTLQNDGISFGSHTCSHRRLQLLPQKHIWDELNVSKEKLEAKLGQEVLFLCYPYGDSNIEIQRMAMTVGYKGACGVNRGKNNPFNLWRCLCRADDSLRTFISKLTWLNYYLTWLREETNLAQSLRKIKHRWFNNND